MANIMANIEDPFAVLATREQAQQQRAQSANLALTERAVARLRALYDSEEGGQALLRVRVNAGGCSGYRTEFSLDAGIGASDLVVEQEGVRVIIDRISAATIGSAQLDFESVLAGESFRLVIPQSHNACGCGVSFAL